MLEQCYNIHITYIHLKTTARAYFQKKVCNIKNNRHSRSRNQREEIHPDDKWFLFQAGRLIKKDKL